MIAGEIAAVICLVWAILAVAAYMVGKERGYKSAKQDFDEEVQATAQAKINRQMHDANRTHLPREDAGPPAKVHRGQAARRPKQRKKS